MFGSRAFDCEIEPKLKAEDDTLIWNSRAYSFHSLFRATEAGKGVLLRVNIGCLIEDFVSKENISRWV